jgi:hypothetical protein
MNSRLMYIELKADGVRGAGRIGRVEFSKTGKTIYYSGRKLAPLKGHGLKANYFDTETLEEFWVSGPKVDGTDSLYGATIAIDEDCRKEYWRVIRKKPEYAASASYRSPGSSKRERDSQEKAIRRRNMDRRWQPARYQRRRQTEGDDGGGESGASTRDA